MVGAGIPNEGGVRLSADTCSACVLVGGFFAQDSSNCGV